MKRGWGKQSAELGHDLQTLIGGWKGGRGKGGEG